MMVPAVVVVLVVAVCAYATVVTASLIADPLVVQTTNGQVQGTPFTIGATGRQWRGIPFAAPPVGPLKFTPPIAPLPWSGIRAATSFGPACIQDDPSSILGPQSEDCLYLNVFVPTASTHRNANATGLLPVMFWIYGGSFIHGAASDPTFDGQHLASHGDVVVVSINYRLGIWGWMVHPALSKENPSFPTSGNYGLLDQSAAMRWVQANIQAFGGDPSRVTVFGESAGSMSTCFQLVMPDSAGLFARTIMESGPCTQHHGNPATSPPVYDAGAIQADGILFISYVNCSGNQVGLGEDSIDCLRQVPVQDMLRVQGVLTTAQWFPAIDGVVVPADPLLLFQQGKFNHADVLLGSNTDEGTLFMTDWNMTSLEYATLVENAFPDHALAITLEYPTLAYSAPVYATSALEGDYFFMCGGRRILRLLNKWSSTLATYQYQFNHVPSWIACPGPYCDYVKMGVFHSAELAFVFNNPPSPSQFNSAEVPLTNAIMEFWSSFAATGIPTSTASPVTWPRFVTGAEQYMVLNDTLSTSAFYREKYCDFWDSISS